MLFSSECEQSDLQRTFLEYPGSFIAGHNTETIESLSLEDCLEQCRNHVECRTVDYDQDRSMCYTQTKTKLDAPATDWYTGYSEYSLYQKMCAWDGRELFRPLRSTQRLNQPPFTTGVCYYTMPWPFSNPSALLYTWDTERCAHEMDVSFASLYTPSTPNPPDVEHRRLLRYPDLLAIHLHICTHSDSFHTPVSQ